MSTRTAVSTTTNMELEEPQHDKSGLHFNEPLSWRAGRPIAIADLLRRLQALAKELSGMEQEENDRETFLNVAKELASPNLLGHKDKGVKAWTACCLVDILKLCAPDAPYTGQQLKDVFSMLIASIFPALADPSNAYNTQHQYVLNSLAQVKSIVLLADIPNSDPLMIQLFRTFFDTMAGSTKSTNGVQLGKNIEFNMTTILVILVDESATLPSEVIDVIVAQFLRTDPRATSGITGKSKKSARALDEKQSTLIWEEPPPAYNMAKIICNTCSEKMARYFSQYFNDVIVDASSSASSAIKPVMMKGSRSRVSDDVNDSDMDIAGGPTDEDLKELNKVHQLLRELWRACPAVLQNVIPQLEAELNAANVHLRSLATETFGDMVSGIGAAGLQPPPTPDPAAYPPITLSNNPDLGTHRNISTKPSSPQPFPQAHPQAYASFLRRCHDRSPSIRSVWTTGIGRILVTSAGGVGLGQQEEEHLIKGLASMMGDADEKVRIAAVKVVGAFGFRDAILKLGRFGGLQKSGSVLANLVDRVRDTKHAVRVEAMRVLARLWGIAAGSIATGEEQVISAIGTAPSVILDTYYANDLDIHVLLDHVMFEQLLPLNYPPIKSKGVKLTNGTSQMPKESQANGDTDVENRDPDKIRTERILLLVKDLDEKAKKVFYVLQKRQLNLAKFMTVFLERCESYNGGVMESGEKDIVGHLKRLIENLARQLPDSSKAIECLWKFAKMHDRRCYQLIRFCMKPETDYRNVVKAIKEFTRRIEESVTASHELLNVLIPLLYRVSVLIYNKSHVPSIMQFSRTNETGLGGTAHELLRDISNLSPEILKAHIQEICTLLQDTAPSSDKMNDSGVVDNLKACASFASKYEKEMPQDRKFVQALTDFALHGTPAEAAKHATTIMMTASNRKEIRAKDLVTQCVKGFQYGAEGFLSRLATLSQLMLLAPEQVNRESDAVSDIAIQEILLQVRTNDTDDSDSYHWSSEVDVECEAKSWALKILVNRIRSHAETDTLSEIAKPVYIVLTNLITNNGDCSPQKNTPPNHKSRLRLLAARLFLKLCTKKHTDALLLPMAFNSLALVAQDPILSVRSSFLQRLKKYLGLQKLSQRFYTIPFLLAFEPNMKLKSETATWIRSRATHFHDLRAKNSSSSTSTIMESVFARLLSLLAHHPDYAATAEDLVDLARYILFYLHPIATEDSISLIYHVAQRVKQMRDAINPLAQYDDNLYHLSDLAQLTIRKFEDAHGWNIQTMPGKMRLPQSLFTEVRDHEESQHIAEKNYLPDGVENGVESLVRSSIRAARSQGKKRKSEDLENGDDTGSRRSKHLPIRKAPAKEKRSKGPTASKTPKSKKRKSEDEVASSERRRSGRVKVSGGRYAERDDEEDDEEMGEGVATWKYEDGPVVDEEGNTIHHERKEEEEEEEAEEQEHTPKPSPKNKKVVSVTTKGRKFGKER